MQALSSKKGVLFCKAAHRLSIEIYIIYYTPFVMCCQGGGGSDNCRKRRRKGREKINKKEQIKKRG